MHSLLVSEVAVQKKMTLVILTLKKRRRKRIRRRMKKPKLVGIYLRLMAVIQRKLLSKLETT